MTDSSARTVSHELNGAEWEIRVNLLEIQRRFDEANVNCVTPPLVLKEMRDTLRQRGSGPGGMWRVAAEGSAETRICRRSAGCHRGVRSVGTGIAMVR